MRLYEMSTEERFEAEVFLEGIKPGCEKNIIRILIGAQAQAISVINEHSKSLGIQKATINNFLGVFILSSPEFFKMPNGH